MAEMNNSVCRIGGHGFGGSIFPDVCSQDFFTNRNINIVSWAGPLFRGMPLDVSDLYIA